MTSNIERISDHAMNIAGYSNMIEKKKIRFSEMAQKEIEELQKICNKMFCLLLEEYDDVVAWHGRIAAMEQRIDDVEEHRRYGGNENRGASGHVQGYG